MINDRETGRHRGFRFIEMDDDTISNTTWPWTAMNWTALTVYWVVAMSLAGAVHHVPA